jgi:hypothetical protein
MPFHPYSWMEIDTLTLLSTGGVEDREDVARWGLMTGGWD